MEANKLEIEKMSWFERNPKKTLVVLLVIFSVIFLLLTEFFLKKKFNIQSNTKERYVQVREVLPNTDTIGASDNTDKKYVRVRTDDNGLLMPGKIHNDPDITLFFIGSSTIMTVTLDEKERLPYITGNMLEKTTGNKVNSFNGAYSSSTSFHGLNILINKVLPYEPDYLIFMYNAVDLIKLRLSPNFYWETNYVSTKSSMFEVLKNFKNKFFPNLYYFLNTNLDFNIGGSIIELFNSLGINTKTKEVNLKTKEVNSNTKEVNSNTKEVNSNTKEVNINSLEKSNLDKTFKNLDFDRAKDNFKKNIKSIIEISKIHNIVPVILTEPWNIKEIKSDENLRRQGLDNFIQYHDEFNSIIRGLGAIDNVILVDLAKHIDEERTELFVEKYHFSNEGVNEVAKLIINEIIKYQNDLDN
ncbi:hypothetical protein OAQ86_06810 [Candidatus Pseudothioglobus singularis]|nr:hypothetical protein [Candidatus Pseudothioglobus singularis]